MEIINEITQLDDFVLFECSTDAFLPPHTCMSMNGSGGCQPYSDPCPRCNYSPRSSYTYDSVIQN